MSGDVQTTIVGNLTGDPELRYTQNGLAVAGFTVAHTPRFFDKQANEHKDGETLFLRCSVWREFAEHVAGSLSKGQRVIVTGTLQAHSYETKEGEQRNSLELKVEAIGPDLRYATAQVTRVASSRDGAAPADAQEPWVPTEPASEDVWTTPGNYSDETPF